MFGDQDITITCQERAGSLFDEGLQECIAAWISNVGVARHALPLDHGGCIVERANHASDITQSMILRPPLFNWLSRLALKIDDIDIAVRHQHLAEMQITMNPREHRTDAGL